jgi:tetratricopeptide (TPR) repeat protein
MRRITCLLAVLATSGTAAAQHARYAREQPGPTENELSARVKPPPPITATSSGKPALDMEAVLSIESLRTPVRAEQEQILAQLIANTPDTEVEEKSDYYFRLGELYAKQQRFFRIKAMELTAQPQQTPALQQQARAASDSAKTYLLKAVKVYKGLTDNDAFRTYPKMDMALFFYAYTLQGGKYMKEARAVYDKLLKTYPNSKFVPEAHLAFADYYFASGQLADAEARYKMVLKFPKSSAYWYATYKLGWVRMNLGNTQDALAAFGKVIAATRTDAKQALLYEAARGDFATAYAKSGATNLSKTDDPYEAFSKLDRDAAIPLVELAADMALANGAYDRAIATYRALLAHHKTDPRACTWQYDIARATIALPTATPVMQATEIEALVHAFANQREPEGECGENASALSAEIAAAWHVEWTRTKDPATLRRAAQLYAAHAAAFPTDIDANASYGEVLWSLADAESDAKARSTLWKRSAEALSRAGNVAAARSAVLGWMNALDIIVPGDAKVALGSIPGKRPREIALAGQDAALVASLAAYQKLAGDMEDEQLPLMRLAVAIVLRKHRMYDAATTMLDELLAKHPQDPHAELAANLMLDSMVRGRMVDVLGDTVDAIAADTEFTTGKTELLANLTKLRVHATR